MAGRVSNKLRSNRLLIGLLYLRDVDILMALMTLVCLKSSLLNLDSHHMLRRCSGAQVLGYDSHSASPTGMDFAVVQRSFHFMFLFEIRSTSLLDLGFHSLVFITLVVFALSNFLFLLSSTYSLLVQSLILGSKFGLPILTLPTTSSSADIFRPSQLVQGRMDLRQLNIELS